LALGLLKGPQRLQRPSKRPLGAASKIKGIDGLTGSPGKSQKEGQEDQAAAFKQLSLSLSLYIYISLSLSLSISLPN